MRVPDVRPREAGRARRRRGHGAAGGLGLYDHFGRQVACRLKAKEDDVGTFRLLVWRMPVCAECPPQGAGAAAAPELVQNGWTASGRPSWVRLSGPPPQSDDFLAAQRPE